MLNKNTMLQNFLLEKGGHVHGKKLQTNFSRRFNFHRILKVFVKQLNSFMLILRRKNSVKVRYQTDQFGGKIQDEFVKMGMWKYPRLLKKQEGDTNSFEIGDTNLFLHGQSRQTRTNHI